MDSEHPRHFWARRGAWQDEEGTVPATRDGDPVAVWETAPWLELESEVLYVSQATAAARRVLRIHTRTVAVPLREE